MKQVQVFVVFLCLSAASCASESPKDSLDPTRSEVQALIEGLVSRFPPKHENLSREFGVWPGEYNTASEAEEQNWTRVGTAYEQLSSLGIVAFPELIAASDDDRYSFSAIYAALVNHSVGDACFMIVESQVDFWGYGYKSRYGDNGQHIVKPQYLSHVRRGEGLKSWWEQRKGRSLRELQLESLTWTIEQEKSIGFVDETQRTMILGPLEARLRELNAPGL